ncbi:DcrB-related protein, partial [Yersinia pseudotuberculosis]
GEYVEATYMAETRRVWQRQVAIQVGDHMMIFTATNASPFNPQQQATWEQWIHSFAPWAREAGHV